MYKKQVTDTKTHTSELHTEDETKDRSQTKYRSERRVLKSELKPTVTSRVKNCRQSLEVKYERTQKMCELL
jgi:hypothetical protein